MELQPMSHAESLIWSVLPWIAQAYFWSLFIVGFAFCVSAYRKTGSRGYILISLFFLQPAVGVGFTKLSHLIHPTEYQQMEEQKEKDRQDRIARGEPVTINRPVTIPFFETVLFLGLLMNAKLQKRAANQTSEAKYRLKK